MNFEFYSCNQNDDEIEMEINRLTMTNYIFASESSSSVTFLCDAVFIDFYSVFIIIIQDFLFFAFINSISIQ